MTPYVKPVNKQHYKLQNPSPFPDPKTVEALVHMVINDHKGVDWNAYNHSHKAAFGALSGLGAVEASKRINVSHTSICEAKFIKEFGTEQDWGDFVNCRLGVVSVARRIRKTLRGQPTAKDLRVSEVLLWESLRPALEGLTSLPKPVDVVNAITRNGSRTKTVNAKLSLATNWLKEFEHEWKNRSGNQDSNSDAQDGDGTAGTEHTEPSSE